MESLLKKIEGFLEGVSLKSLITSSKKMSEEYRGWGKRAHLAEEDVWAYLASRMPATYAALVHVVQELQARVPDFAPLTLLDAGCGPGTSLWAAQRFFPQLEHLHCLEKEQHFLDAAKRLAEDLQLYPNIQWQLGDMRKELPDVSCDLVIASYSLGELAGGERLAVVQKLWERTKGILVLIESGTPKGFALLREVRKYLIDAKAHLLAPCPHSHECPLLEGDWCHFYARLNRSGLHRRVKKGQLNYEDEKFSYLLFSRDPASPPLSRIVRHPRKGKGHVHVTLCTPKGIEESVVTKKDGDLYQIAKKSSWGDSFSRPQ
ncbi:MAG TPA: small ribosomal subunit Rsm22 family protein [Rhabdochlamydiaceae bacterium]|jgi:ribosomal protein RSM22 (predicted rRNA methylase)